jgi:hypothetical protein
MPEHSNHFGISVAAPSGWRSLARCYWCGHPGPAVLSARRPGIRREYDWSDSSRLWSPHRR